MYIQTDPIGGVEIKCCNFDSLLEIFSRRSPLTQWNHRGCIKDS